MEPNRDSKGTAITSNIIFANAGVSMVIYCITCKIHKQECIMTIVTTRPQIFTVTHVSILLLCVYMCMCVCVLFMLQRGPELSTEDILACPYNYTKWLFEGKW